MVPGARSAPCACRPTRRHVPRAVRRILRRAACADGVRSSSPSRRRVRGVARATATAGRATRECGGGARLAAFGARAAAPATRSAARSGGLRRARSDARRGPRLARSRHAANRRGQLARWISAGQHVKPGNLMPAFAIPAGRRAGRDRRLSASCVTCGDERRVDALPNTAAAAGRRARRAAPRLAAARGLAAADRSQQQLHRRLLHRAPRCFLRARRRPRAADARAARACPTTRSSAPSLQPDLHHARHGDDVPVRRAGGRGDGRAAAAEHARRARPAVPAAVAPTRSGPTASAALVFFCTLFFGARARRRLVHVPAADRARSFSPGVGADFWLLGIGFIEISAIAGAIEIIVGVLRTRAPGMTLDTHADVRLDHAGLRA